MGRGRRRMDQCHSKPRGAVCCWQPQEAGRTDYVFLPRILDGGWPCWQLDCGLPTSHLREKDFCDSEQPGWLHHPQKPCCLWTMFASFVSHWQPWFSYAGAKWVFLCRIPILDCMWIYVQWICDPWRQVEESPNYCFLLHLPLVNILGKGGQSWAWTCSVAPGRASGIWDVSRLKRGNPGDSSPGLGCRR